MQAGSDHRRHFWALQSAGGATDNDGMRTQARFATAKTAKKEGAPRTSCIRREPPARPRVTVGGSSERIRDAGPAFDFSRLAIHPPTAVRTRSTTESRDGDVVTRTQALGPPGGPAPLAVADHCALTAATFSSIPSASTIRATLNGSRLEAPFVMRATFTNPIPCTCANGEYRQYVRGAFTANGTPVTHMLGPGRPLSPTTFQEDGDVAAGTVYGHRSVLGTKSRFLPDQVGGCQFEGEDEPGISASSGTTVSMSLDFRGDLIDTVASNRVLTRAEWSVGGSASIP